MKNLYKLLLAFLVALVSTVSSFAYDFSAKNEDGVLIYYNILSEDEKTCEIARSPNYDYTGDIIIPSTVNCNNINYTVTRTGVGAFGSCDNLKSVILPDCLTSIGVSTFFSCDELTYVYIPSSVTSIEGRAFHLCINLKSITLPAGVTSIGLSAFRECANLMSVNIPNGVTIIEDYTFFGCSSLTNIIVPGGVTSIGNSAFYGCTNLKSVNIPDGVTKIEITTFSDCSSLTNIELPAGVTSIGRGAFQNCSSLTRINIPDGVTKIEENLFSYCSSLTNIKVPVGVTSIGRWAFSGCTNLTSVNIPDGVTKIEDYTFEDCINLSNITIPAGVSSIGCRSFSGCSGLKKVICKSLTPPEEIPDEENLVHLSLPSLNFKLYVPEESIDLYKTSNSWKKNNRTYIPLKYIIYKGDLLEDAADNLVEAKTLAEGTPNSLIFADEELFGSDVTANVVYRENEEWVAKEIALTDEQPFYCPEDVEVETITYTRQFKDDKWQALYLPFGLSHEEWSDDIEVAYFNNIHQYDTDGDGVIVRTTIEFFIQNSGELKPNTPYMVKAKTPKTVTLTGKNKTLAATSEKEGYVDCMSTRYYYKISGFYQPKTDLYQNGQFAVSGGGFKKAASSAAVVPSFRIYMDVSDRTSNGDGGALAQTRAISISIDGKIIDEMEDEDVEEIIETPSSYYDIKGRRVTEPKSPGLYIKNGRKVIIK